MAGVKAKHHSAGLPLRALALAIALSLATPSLFAAADPEASRLYEDALQRYDKKDYRGAVIQLKNALQIDRKMLPVQVLLARALLADNQISAAEVAFNEALALGVDPAEVVVPLAEAVAAQGRPGDLLSQPRFAHTALPPQKKSKLLLLKAAAASDLGDHRQAIRLLEESRALDSISASSWLAEVPIRVRARQFKEAALAADKALALEPKSADAVYQRATVAHVSGDLKAALALYSRAVELDAGQVDALVARAGIWIDQGRFDQAAADVAAARKAAADDPRAAYLAALVSEHAGNVAEMRKNLADVGDIVDAIPRESLRYRPQALMLGGLAHFGLGEYEKAQPYLESALRQDPGTPASKLLAQVYLRQQSVPKAIDVLEGYLRAHPDDRQATMLLASSMMTVGRYARAAQLSEHALEQADEPAMRALLGISLVGAGKFAPGAAELEAALRKDPRLVQAGVSLVGLYLASGQVARAAEVAAGLVKQQPDNAGLLSLQGRALAAKGEVAAARAAFERSSKIDPSFAEPQLGLARLEIGQRAFDAADQRLQALLAKDAHNVDAMMQLSRLAAARGQEAESLRWLQKADDDSGARLAPGLALVDYHLDRRRPDLAREAIKRLQGKAPEAMAVLLAQARVQTAGGELGDARATLTRATTLASYDAAALTKIAELQLRAGNVPGAAYALDKALEAKPDHLGARRLRSTVYVAQGEFAKAEQLARSIVASDPKLGVGHGLLGDVARARWQMQVAIDEYKRAHAIEHSTISAIALFNALDATQHAGAVAFAQGWLRERPQDTVVRRALADSQLRAGNLRAARTAYEALLEADPQDADALNNLAIALIGLNDPSASKVAERALALRPQTAYVVGTAGWAAFHAGQYDRALQLLRDARLRDPNNPSTRYFLAAVLARHGRAAEAKEEVSAALRFDPGFAYAKEAQSLLQTLK